MKKELINELEQRIHDDISEQEIYNLSRDLEELTKKIAKKKREITTVMLLRYLEKNALEKEINIYLTSESGRDYIDVDIIEELYDENSSNIAEEIRDLITLSADELYTLYSYNPSAQFINNEEGRDEVIKMFIGKDWQEWKKSGQIMERYNKMNENLPKISSERKQSKNKL